MYDDEDLCMSHIELESIHFTSYSFQKHALGFSHGCAILLRGIFNIHRAP